MYLNILPLNRYKIAENRFIIITSKHWMPSNWQINILNLADVWCTQAWPSKKYVSFWNINFFCHSQIHFYIFHSLDAPPKNCFHIFFCFFLLFFQLTLSYFVEKRRKWNLCILLFLAGFASFGFYFFVRDAILNHFAIFIMVRSRCLCCLCRSFAMYAVVVENWI